MKYSISEQTEENAISICFVLPQRSRYSDWLPAGWLRGRISSPGSVKNFLFSISSRSALRPAQLPMQWVPETLSPRLKRQGREADRSLRTSAEVNKIVDLYIHSPTRFHDVVLIQLNTGTILLTYRSDMNSSCL
jgi:hypothetical protein